MQVDLYTLYLYSYSNEYLFNKNPDLIKIESFSKASNCIFIDDFLIREVIANTPLDFFDYLKNRECFKIQISKKKTKKLVIECSCRFSLEYWIRESEEEKDGQLLFKKAGEFLWVTKYSKISEKEILEARSKLKEAHYKEY